MKKLSYKEWVKLNYRKLKNGNYLNIVPHINEGWNGDPRGDWSYEHEDFVEINEKQVKILYKFYSDKIKCNKKGDR